MLRIAAAGVGGYFLGHFIGNPLANAVVPETNASNFALRNAVFVVGQITTGVAIYWVLGKVL